MDLVLPSVLLAAIVVVVVAYRAYRRAQLRQVEWWRALGQQHGLTVHDPGEPHEVELEGDYRGIPIKVSMGGGRSSTRHRLFTHVVAALPGGAPPGLLLTTQALEGPLGRERKAPLVEIDDTELSSTYAVHGVDPDKTLDVLGNADLRELLLQAAKVADYVRVDGRAVAMEKQGVLGKALPGFVDLAARLAAAISEAHDRPWSSFARKHRMVFKGAGGNAVDRVLRGHIAGRRVAIEMGTVPGNPDVTFTTIKVAVGARLPAGLRVTPKAGETVRGAFELGVPALDRVVHVQGTRRDEVRALLSHPPLRDHMVAFYEVCPYTIVENNMVIAGGPGLLTGDMDAQVSAVMDLSNAIREAWERVNRPAGQRRAAPG